jgi:hypothetical protein
MRFGGGRYNILICWNWYSDEYGEHFDATGEAISLQASTQITKIEQPS